MEERKKFRCTKFLIRKSLNNGDYLLYFVFQRFLSGWDGTGSWLEVSSVFAAHPSAETEHYMWATEMTQAALTLSPASKFTQEGVPEERHLN